MLRIHKRGFALDDQEAVTGARCIAVPLLNWEQKVIAAISISGPVVRVTKKHVVEFADKLRLAAAEIVQRLSAFSE